jgi:hypothetical protein
MNNTNDFRNTNEEPPLKNGDPYRYGRKQAHTTWDKIRQTAGIVVTRTVDVAGDLAQRGLIEMEIGSLRLRLKSLYAKLGELVFQLKFAEELEDVLNQPGIKDLFERIKSTHAEIAAERSRLETLSENANRDEFAGA